MPHPMKRIALIAGLVLVLVLASAPTALAADRSWPFPIPCRTHDDANPDLLFMTLGEVDTPVAQGIFDPRKDEVQLKDGTVQSNYYRDVLGVKYYQPLDKSRFPLPPSGWCTWYYYY